jgi:hypothetical protein
VHQRILPHGLLLQGPRPSHPIQDGGHPHCLCHQGGASAGGSPATYASRPQHPWLSMACERQSAELKPDGRRSPWTKRLSLAKLSWTGADLPDFVRGHAWMQARGCRQHAPGRGSSLRCLAHQCRARSSRPVCSGSFSRAPGLLSPPPLAALGWWRQAAVADLRNLKCCAE